jgi:hypothetical protein
MPPAGAQFQRGAGAYVRAAAAVAPWVRVTGRILGLPGPVSPALTATETTQTRTYISADTTKHIPGSPPRMSWATVPGDSLPQPTSWDRPTVCLDRALPTPGFCVGVRASCSVSTVRRRLHSHRHTRSDDKDSIERDTISEIVLEGDRRSPTVSGLPAVELSDIAIRRTGPRDWLSTVTQSTLPFCPVRPSVVT